MGIKLPVYKVKLVRDHTATYPSGIVEDPKATAAFFHALIGMADREHFAALFLDAVGRPSGANIIGIGTLNNVTVTVREFFKAAILANAESIICAHNHPAGVPFPSANDLGLTRRLVFCGRILGVHVTDHFIVTPSGEFISMSEGGFLTAVREEAA